jgi:hypothetical protein
MKQLSAKATRRRSQRQERELAEDTGGKVQKGSGCLPWAKSDVTNVFGRFRAECKFTRARSFTLTRELIYKLRGECDFHEIPVIDVSFVSAAGKTDERWICMPYAEWLRQNGKE